MRIKRALGPIAIFILAMLAAAGLGAQSTGVPASRLAGDWRSSPPVAVSIPPPIVRIGPNTGVDQGSAAAGLVLKRMILLLAASPAQQQALAAELAALQNPSSPQYHQWLTPAEFAASYANSASDVAAVAAWLQSQGFQVAPIPAGRGYIEFSGTVAQAEQAFAAPIHIVAGPAGTARPTLIGGLSVPAALRPLIAGLVSLDGVLSTPALTLPQPLAASPADLAAQTSPSSAAALTPALAAQLLNLPSGVTGAGQSIAIAARSNVNASDVAAFRAAFNLSPSPLSVIPSGVDPGLTESQDEATLAASWAGAAAPGAQIILVPAATTSATDGVDLSLASIVNRDLAGTVEVGYSVCEAGMSAAHQAFYAALYQQAAAEGISIVAAAGDSGAAACALPGSGPVATGYGVNAMASTPWDTAVGVASLAAGSTLAAWSPRSAADPAYAGAGGSSLLYAPPSWQPAPAQLPAAVRGSPNRLLPDLSLPTALDTSTNPGLAFCLSSSANIDASGCTLVRAGGSGAAASLFAGIAALMAQKHGLEGNLAPTLYQLSNTPGVFTDVAQGSAQLPCVSGSSGCDSTGHIGFSASAGYDLATGLGVPNVTALIDASPETNGTAQAIATNTIASGQVINPSGSVVLSATITSGSGGAAPTGTVTFFDQTTNSNIVTVSLSPSGGSSSNASQTVTGALATGSHSIIAEYSGDTTYAAANSSAVVVQAQPSTTTTTVTPATNSPSAGSTLIVTAVVSSANAGAGALAPSGTVTFNLDGASQGTGRLIAGLASGAQTNSSTSFSMTMPYTAGSHTITAAYAGDTNYTTSTSSGAAINVGTSTPTVTLTSSTTTPGAGANFTLSVTVAPPGTGTGAVAPTGTVTFTLNGATIGQVTLVPGSNSSTASLTTSAPAIGTYTAQANYGGDSSYNAASSSTLTINVGKTGTTLSVTPSTTSPTANSSLQVTATLTPSSSTPNLPTGTITVTLDGATAGTATLTGNTMATIYVTMPASGTHTLAATYSGDGNFAASTAPGVTLTIAKTATTTTANPNTTTPTLGNSLTVTSTITPTSYSGGGPTGTVTYTLDGTQEGVQSVTQGTPSTSSIIFAINTAGTHTLLAAYSGDNTYAASTSSPVTLTVAKVGTTATVSPSTTSPQAGASMQATATILLASSGLVAPTGSVVFTIDGTTVATVGITSSTPSEGTATATFTVPSAGSHTLVATYNGDTNYSGSTSSGVTLSVSKSTPTILVQPASYSPPAGSNLQVTAQITPPANGATSPSGTVTFSLDGASIGTASVNSGNPATATITITTPSVGTHTLSATYSGDSNYNTVTASTVTINVTKGTTTLTVTPSSTTPTANTTMLVTATISATISGTTIPTGSVSFLLDGASAGSGTVSGGTTATTTITVPASGTHTLQATYSGDSNFNGSTSAPATFTVAKTTTTTVLIPSTTTPALGSTLPVTASVTASANTGTLPTGTISFTLDGVSEGVEVMTSGSPGTANFTYPSLTPGTHVLTAVYSGDAYYATSTSANVTITVAKSPTTMTVTPSTTTPAGGSSLAVSSTIVASSPGAAPPTGTVNFTIDGTTAATSAVVPGTPATATGTIAALDAGTHVLSANYSGDSYYAAATAGSVIITVSKSPTTITISPSTLTPTAGGSMVITANISSSNPATASPSGTVTIAMDGVTVGSGTVIPGTPSIANVTIPLVSAGSHLLSGTYSGDSYYTGSTSSTVAITASKGATTTTVTATPPTLTTGTSETLTATIAPVTSVTGTTYTFSGAVSFYDGTTLLGQVAVSGDTATLSGLNLAANTNHSITAVYSGDNNWLPSTSSALSMTASTLADTVVLTSNYTVAPPGVSVIFTATVTPSTTPGATTEQNPTGSVVFYSGTVVVGTATLIPNGNSLNNSSIATFTTSNLPGGPDTITAYYEGDLTYSAGLSNALAIIVQSFTITPASTNPPTNLNIVQGGAGAISFNIAGYGGFNNQIQVVCQVPTQDELTCTPSPQEVVPPTTVTFVVQTYTTPLAHSRPPQPFWPRAAGGTALAGLVFFLLPFGRRARTFLRQGMCRALVLLLLLAGLAASGIGCTNNAALATFGTPLGVATLKIIAQANVDNTTVSQTAYFTVNVTTQ